jgi:hypothetical protein
MRASIVFFSLILFNLPFSAFAQSGCFPSPPGGMDRLYKEFTARLKPHCQNAIDEANGIWGSGIISLGTGTKYLVQLEKTHSHCPVKDTYLEPSLLEKTNRLGQSLARGDNEMRFDSYIDNSKFTQQCRRAMAQELCDALGQHCKYRNLIGAPTIGGATAEPGRSSNLDTPERLQAAQANQQQADRAFAGKKRVHDDNANTEQPTTGSREGSATNRGPVRVNVAYCMDSYKRAYSGNLKCSAQRFGYTSLEPGQTVDVLGPNSGLQALTFGCKHPTKPYDVEFVNDGLSGRCAAY